MTSDPSLAEKMDRLAARLGVQPHTPAQGPTWLVKFGPNAYDVLQLISALLDRLEDLEATDKRIGSEADERIAGEKGG